MSSGPAPSRFATWAPELSRRRCGFVAVEVESEADVRAAARLAESYTGVNDGWEERLGHDVVGSDRALFVAKVSGQVVGYSRVRSFSPPKGAPADTMPAGWYLGGLIVVPDRRRCGVGEALTRVRLDWVAERATEVWYYVNATNRASLALHEGLGFEEVTREFTVPGWSFDGGVGVLCRAMFLGGESHRDNSADKIEPTQA